MEIVAWIITALSLCGVVLNIRRRRECFYLWSVSNIGWVAVDFHAGLYAQTALCGIYFVLSIWGIWGWKDKDAD